MTTADDIKSWIVAGMPEADVAILGDDGAHFEARIVAAAFEGQSTVARHRMVYAALGPRMGREIHALALKTLTPAEAGQA
ncbi:MAG: BolA family protein [Oceanococcaceae bacterium]